MKQYLLLVSVFCAVTSTSFAQIPSVFQERPDRVDNQFISVEKLRQEAKIERYGELARGDGFLVTEVLSNGSAFTKSLHRSGKVIFNCEATDYLNAIKSRLLSEYGEIDKLINVYITENSALNAFATVNNNIYVNIGLLARVENESQLAYILSHEIMHVVNSHIIKETLKVSEQAKVYTASDIAQNTDFLQLYRHNLSQEHESESDMYGFTLYKKAGYDVSEARKALELLSRANDYILPIEASAAFFDIADSVYQVWNTDLAKLLSEEKKVEELSTHPTVEKRLEDIENALKNETVLSGSEIDSKKFGVIRNAARTYVLDIFAHDLDFLSLYLHSKYNLIEGTTEKSQKEYFYYSLQGLAIDKSKGFKAGIARSTNSADSLLSAFYTSSDKEAFYYWLLKQFEHDNGLNQAEKELYKNAVLYTVKKDIEISELKSLSEYKAEIEKIEMDSKGIAFDSLSFNISPFADLPRKVIKSYIGQELAEPLEDAKLAILNSNNIVVKRTASGTRVDLVKSEMTEDRLNQVWKNLEEDYSKEVVSLSPNGEFYKGSELVIYDALNSWLHERVYFEGYNYRSINDSIITDIMRDEDIRYLFSTLNIEIKSFSFKAFLATYFAPFFMPLYIPQLVANIVNSSSRKYQLSLVFDIKTGALNFYDKRTYLEANSLALLQQIYNNVIESILKK